MSVKIKSGDPFAAIAEDNYKLGCVLLQSMRFEEALKCFNDAIDFCKHNPDYYCSRSECLIDLCRFDEAMRDANKAITLKRYCLKAYEHQMTSFLKVGDFAGACKVLNALEALRVNNLFTTTHSQLLNDIIKHIEAFQRFSVCHHYALALDALDPVVNYATHSITLIVSKASLLSHLKRYQEAHSFAKRALSMDPKHGVALHILNLCETELASAAVQQNRKQRISALKLEASAAVAAKKYEKAYEIYSRSLFIDPSNDSENAKLHFNRSIVSAKLGKMNEAIDNCTVAIKLSPNYLKAYLRRAKLYSESVQFEACVTDYQKVVELDNNEEYRILLERAKTQLKLSKLSELVMKRTNRTGETYVDKQASFLNVSRNFYVVE